MSAEDPGTPGQEEPSGHGSVSLEEHEECGGLEGHEAEAEPGNVCTQEMSTVRLRRNRPLVLNCCCRPQSRSKYQILVF